MFAHEAPICRSVMISSPDETQFLGLLLKTLNAKNSLEIGVYTGYSLALPDDGKIVAIDMNREFYEIGRPIRQKAGVAHKIDFRESPALPILDQLVSETLTKPTTLTSTNGCSNLCESGESSAHRLRQHSLVRELLPGPLEERPELVRFTKEFNIMIAAGKRLEVSMLSVADGLCFIAVLFDG